MVGRLVVVGAGLAGLRAAEAARKAGHDGPLLLVGDEAHLPYDRPPLSKEFLAPGESVPADPHLRDADHLREELRLEHRPGAAATGLDVAGKRLLTTAGEVEYDALVVATGASARTLPGAEGLANVFALRTLDDAHAIRSALEAEHRLVVVGAGFIGGEVASAARERGLPVTLVESLPTPLVRSLGPDVGELCAAMHVAHGTDLRLGTGVEELRSAAGRCTAVRLSDGTEVAADTVVVGIGAAPATGWLAGSGVALHERDRGVLCDETLAVLGTDGQPLPGVYAAGDVAWWPNPTFDGAQMRLEHWTSAAEQGATAARNALGAGKPYATVPYFWSDLYKTRMQFVGVPHAEDHLTREPSDGRGGTLVLYRRGDALGGALTIGRPDLVMKYRRLLMQHASWDEAVSFGAVAA